MSAAVSDRTRADTRALRLLRDGMSPRQAAEATGLRLGQVEQLARDFGARRAAPSPRPAAAATAPGTVWLPAAELFVDGAYQRDLDMRRVLRMVRDYDPRLLGVLEVSDRGAGAAPRYAVVDGAHRWELARHVDPAGEQARLLCHVHRGLTPGQEAALFYTIDSSRRRLTGWDRWKARHASGEQTVVDIVDTVQACGLRLAHATTAKTVSSSLACEQIVALGGLPLLTRTLRVLLAAYGEREHFDYDLLGGVSLVLHHYPDVDDAWMVRALAATLPGQLKARGRAMRLVASGSLIRLVAAVVVQQCNDHRAGRRALPSFLATVPARPAAPPREVDPVAVARAAAGDPPDRLTPAERKVAVADLTDRGHSAADIAERLRITERQVVRLRGGDRPNPQALNRNGNTR